MMNDEEPSPCISVCVLDENDVCQGCFRTGEEITDWWGMKDDDKLKVIGKCKERRADSGWVL